MTSLIVLTTGALFTVGALRCMIRSAAWWRVELEMFALGAIVAAVAFASGAGVAALVAGG